MGKWKEGGGKKERGGVDSQTEPSSWLHQLLLLIDPIHGCPPLSVPIRLGGLCDQLSLFIGSPYLHEMNFIKVHQKKSCNFLCH